MNHAQSEKCLGCKEVFEADPRNLRHQKYCSKPACQKASKAASQRLWLAKPENEHYHSGPEAGARVREWQKTHPEYRERQKAKRSAALQDHCNAQAPDSKQEFLTLPELVEISAAPVSPALQDFIGAQPYVFNVFIGFISHFFGQSLQDDISETAHTLQKLGEDIANGKGPDEFLKTGNLFGASAAGAGAVQLGGSAPGEG
jgi:hypothetical protein